MGHSIRRSIILLIVVPVLLLAFVSCVTESSKSRGSLSDAMNKAQDDFEEEREVPDEEEEPRKEKREREERRRDETDEGELAETATTEPRGPVYIAGRGGNSFVSEPYFDSQYDADLLVGYGEDRVEVLVFGGIKAVTAKKGSTIEESIDDGVLFLRAGLEGRYYPLPELQVFSPYLLAQVGGLYMYWSFKNPLEAGGETIISDSVGGMILSAGAGVQLINTPFFRLGASCIPEAHLFYSETQEGFDNDVFDAYGTVRWSIEMGFFSN